MSLDNEIKQTLEDYIVGGALSMGSRQSRVSQRLAEAFDANTQVKNEVDSLVFAKDKSTVGIGAGQMSRVDAARIAVQKAADTATHQGWDKPRTIGAVAASDAFFPFADGLQALVAAGASAVIQPGGSMRDDAVIAAANEAGIAMVFTGMRHFNH